MRLGEAKQRLGLPGVPGTESELATIYARKLRGLTGHLQTTAGPAKSKYLTQLKQLEEARDTVLRAIRRPAAPPPRSPPPPVPASSAPATSQHAMPKASPATARWRARWRSFQTGAASVFSVVQATARGTADLAGETLDILREIAGAVQRALAGLAKAIESVVDAVVQRPVEALTVTAAILLLFGGSVGIRWWTSSRPAAVRFETWPAARVLVDGAEAGEAPGPQLRRIPNGERAIRFVPKNGGPPYSFKAEFLAGRTYAVRVNQKTREHLVEEVKP